MSSTPRLQAPFADFLGIKITHISPERVEAELPVRGELATVPAILHGGALMALADNLGGVATVANLPKGARTATIESKTNFFAGIPVGETARAECSPPAPRPHHDGVADQDHACRRQALRAGDPDPDRHPGREKLTSSEALCRPAPPEATPSTSFVWT
jgi:uncharacterized protein (TIGR00369 family)